MKIRISKYQFFLMFWCYVIANDIIRGYWARQLKMDLSISVPTSILLSLILYFLYSFIYKNNNYDSFDKCIENILGKFLSKVIFIIYPIYFIFITFFYVRDISEVVQIIYIEAALIFLLGFFKNFS